MHGQQVWIRRVLALGMASVLVSVSQGCSRGDGLNRVIVAGTVTLDGTPAEDGQIRFIPQHNTPGPTSVSPIQHGRYECKDFGGVPAGEHRVEILIWDPKAPKPTGPGQAPRPQWAPEKYNQTSELMATVDASRDMKTTDWNLQGATK